MKIITSIDEINKKVRDLKHSGKSIGLVPTTGHLHEGHGGLIERSVEENDFTIVSVVAGNSAGSERQVNEYKGDIKLDAAFAEKLGADVVFCPVISELYPEDFCSYVDMTGITEQLIGLARPVHYRSYCTCMNKLFNITIPDSAYYGRKDPQQLAVISKLVADMNLDIRIVGCDICREEDGLAMSSHNDMLTAEEREAALCLSRAVEVGENAVVAGETSARSVLSSMKKIINDEPLAVIDYIKALDAKTMQAVSEIKPGTVVTLAVYIGRVRLTDNFNVD